MTRAPHAAAVSAASIEPQTARVGAICIADFSALCAFAAASVLRVSGVSTDASRVLAAPKSLISTTIQVDDDTTGPLRDFVGRHQQCLWSGNADHVTPPDQVQRG